MDNYPDHVAPELDEGGGVATPFEVWWPIVRGHFHRVPEEVARDWLHRHWAYSPFKYLRSADYRFDRIQMATDDLFGILSGWNNFAPDPADCIAQGRYLVEEHHPTWTYPTVSYMTEHRSFPVPITVLDNRSGRLAPGKEEVPMSELFPTGMVLIEGHRRFNIALYLATKGRLAQTVPIWLMTYDPER